MYPSLIPSLPLGSFLGKRPGKRKENDIFLPQGIWWGRWAYTQGEVLGNGKVEAGGSLQIQPWRTGHPTRGRRQGRLPGRGDAAAVLCPGEEKTVLQAKRQRVRLAKQSLPHNGKDSTSRKDPEDGIAGLEGMQSWHSATAVFLTGRPNRTKGQRRR